MSHSVREILTPLFFDARIPASSHADVSIDVLDSWTNSDVASVRGTITRITAADALAVY
jgi:hypothetical protein